MRTNFHISHGHCKSAPPYAWAQLRSGAGVVLPLLQPLLFQPGPLARMHVWRENRGGTQELGVVVPSMLPGTMAGGGYQGGGRCVIGNIVGRIVIGIS